MKYVMIVVSIICMVTGISCVALSRHLTPGTLDTDAISYVVEAGVADVNEYGGYANLYKVNKLKLDVDIAHTYTQFDLQQLIDEDVLDYSILKNVVSKNFDISIAREKAVFGEKGLLSMGLTLAGFGTLTGVVGLMRKRPQDITQEELNKALSTTGLLSKDAIACTSKHLTQVIKGINKFAKKYEGNEDIILALHAACNEAQDDDTKNVVGSIKRGI